MERRAKVVRRAVRCMVEERGRSLGDWGIGV